LFKTDLPPKENEEENPTRKWGSPVAIREGKERKNGKRD
jgi:hypothetical protein